MLKLMEGIKHNGNIGKLFKKRKKDMEDIIGWWVPHEPDYRDKYVITDVIITDGFKFLTNPEELNRLVKEYIECIKNEDQAEKEWGDHFEFLRQHGGCYYNSYMDLCKCHIDTIKGGKCRFYHYNYPHYSEVRSRINYLREKYKEAEKRVKEFQKIKIFKGLYYIIEGISTMRVPAGTIKEYVSPQVKPECESTRDITPFSILIKDTALEKLLFPELFTEGGFISKPVYKYVTHHEAFIRDANRDCYYFNRCPSYMENTVRFVEKKLTLPTEECNKKTIERLGNEKEIKVKSQEMLEEMLSQMKHYDCNYFEDLMKKIEVWVEYPCTEKIN